ncbi:MAG TPA: hypothetical protein VFV81_01350 [Verrucomicrobiae bacterium]|nr:hypothetical protein [Verrucomicrobiae bacterium]
MNLISQIYRALDAWCKRHARALLIILAVELVLLAGLTALYFHLLHLHQP